MITSILQIPAVASLAIHFRMNVGRVKFDWRAIHDSKPGGEALIAESWTKKYDPPHVWVGIPYAWDDWEADRADTILIVVAHELGHIVDAFPKTVVQQQAGRRPSTIIQDEWNAWENARILLTDIGFDNWLLFSEILCWSIGTYERTYGLQAPK